MDYGRIAYLKCAELEGATERGRRAEFFRGTKCEGGETELFGTDPVTVRGRGRAEFRFFAPGGSFLSVRAGEDTLACPPGDSLRLSVAGTPGGRVVQAFCRGASEIFTFAGGERPCGGDGNGRGVAFSVPDGLCADGETLWIARGGKLLGYRTQGEEVTLARSVAQFGIFAVSGGAFYWLCAEGLFRSARADEKGELFAKGASAFAVSGTRVCWIRDGKLFDCEEGETVVRPCPGGERLRFSGGTLLVERGGSSWNAGTGERYCAGVGACERAGRVYAAKEGVLFRDGVPVGLGEEAVLFGEEIFVRTGSMFYRLEENV